MTFKELVDYCTNPRYIFDKSPPEIRIYRAPKNSAYIEEISGFTLEGVFVAANPGYCFNIENYGVDRDTLSIQIELGWNHWNKIEPVGDIFDVYLTDKKHWIMTSSYLPSHWGPTLSFNNEYLIEIEKVSNFDPKNPESCKDYDDNDYQNFINNRLPFLDCNPPWYSTQNPCTSVYDQNIYSSVLIVLDSMIYGYHVWNKCPKPCTVTQSKIQTKSLDTLLDPYKYLLTLTFNENVLKRTKSFSYGWSEFGVDMGSHLGLWFGLSFWSIKTLSIRFYKWTQKVREHGLKQTLLDV